MRLEEAADMAAVGYVVVGMSSKERLDVARDENLAELLRQHSPAARDDDRSIQVQASALSSFAVSRAVAYHENRGGGVPCCGRGGSQLSANRPPQPLGGEPPMRRTVASGIL